jgi:PPK2 family polyphosphate:nucleotide phosphotransferase
VKRMEGRWRADPTAEHPVAGRDPGSTADAPGDREATEADVLVMQERLVHLQLRLWAEGRRSILMVLQGIDASGKDGTISKVFRGLDPLALRVASFKVPTEEELAHDFLWRVHAHCPRSGEIAIFNRSHYEDVLAVRVRGTVPEELWRPRYAHINAFEALLRDAGTTLIKVLLHISKAEQEKRLDERQRDPEKAWKIRSSDFEDRKLWGAYEHAFEDMVRETSTPDAPWYVVPADHKWYRNWVVTRILLDTLEAIDPHPGPTRDS